MSDYLIDSSCLQSIANAIRSKNGSGDTYTPAQMAAAIAAIPAGSAPRLPAAYQEVEFIQTDGSAYLDTGYVFSGTAVLDMKVYRPNVTNWYLFGTAEDSGKKRFMVGATGNGNVIIYGSAASNFASAPMIFRDSSGGDGDSRNSVMRLFGRVAAGCASITEMETVNSASSNACVDMPLTNTCLFFAENYNATVRISQTGTRAYWLKLWDGPNKTPVRDLVPCYRKADNVIGMYDLANDVFYQNVAGSGAFAKGPDI